MKLRAQRIEAFINSLETVEMPGESKSILLSNPDMDLLGGANTPCNSKKCDNGNAESCSGKNKECVNYKGLCGASDNEKCLNKEPAPGIETNLIISNCGQ